MTDRHRIRLSICICSLHERRPLLQELLECLSAQDCRDETEILIITDSGQELIGSKRNRLIAQARGEYIVHIDDDDLVDSKYIKKILDAIDNGNDGLWPDAILVRGERTENGNADDRVLFDYRIGGEEGVWINGVLWRSPGHLCPIRSDIVKSIPFPTPRTGEDLAWNTAIRPLIKTAVRAGVEGEILYHYRWDSIKPEPFAHMINRSHAEIFTPQYTDYSGPGSTLESTEPYRMFLGGLLLRSSDIHSILDLGCGDMVVMSQVMIDTAINHQNHQLEFNTTYFGADVIGARIEKNRAAHPKLYFEAHDIRTWTYPRSDLIVCKDVIQHWSTDEIHAWLAHLKQQAFKFALVTNCNYGQTVNQDIHTGGWRAIDLTRPPFSVGEVVFKWRTKDVVLIRGQD